MRLSCVLHFCLGIGSAAAVTLSSPSGPGVDDAQLLEKRADSSQVCRVFGVDSLLFGTKIYQGWGYLTLTSDYLDGKAYPVPPRIFDFKDAKAGSSLAISLTNSPKGNSTSGTFNESGNGVTSMETGWMNPNGSALLPFVTRSAPWFDGKNKIYKYGGVYADPEVWPSLGFTIGKNKFWSLDTTTGRWQEEYPKGAEGLLAASTGATANVPELGLGFYAGGVVYNRTDATFTEWGLNITITPYFFLKTMLIYDMHTNEVRNTTIGLMQPFYGGSLQYVPAGNKGMLILMGGIEEDSGVLLPRSFDHIYVYDIDTEKWFHQTAGGSIPDNRANFCTAVASAPDGSSHSIYMHGGAFDLTYADTYVLSVPAFQWVRIDDGINQPPRTRHSCHMTKQKQMWVVGGKPQAQEDPHAPKWANGECFKNPLWNIFDVNTGEWQDNLVPITDEAVDYKVPKAVTDVIGGNEAGGATMRQPKDGWEESILDELWKEAPLPNVTTTSAAPSASATAAKKGAAMKPIAEVSTLLASLVLTAVGMMFL